MNKTYKVMLTESAWDRTIDRMLASQDPILIMTAKQIVYQIELEKQVDRMLETK